MNQPSSFPGTATEMSVAAVVPRPWWDRARIILPLLCLLFPFALLKIPIGLIPLWAGRRFSKMGKLALSAPYALVILLLLIASLYPDDEQPPSDSQDHHGVKSASVATEEINRGPLNVSMSVTTKLVDSRLYVEAKTNLPDSTSIGLSLFGDIAGERYISQKKATVVNGTFSSGPFSYKGESLPAGDYELSATVPVTSVQPASVKAIFGEKGVNLTGPLVQDSEYGGRIAQVEQIVTVGDNGSLRQLSQLTDLTTSYRKDLEELYNELMDFKDDPYFHEFGFSPSAAKFKKWQLRVEALREREAPSYRGAVAVGELLTLGSEYRRSKGAETEYSKMVRPNMKSFIEGSE